MLDQPILIFDVETTGLDTQKDRIVQFASILIKSDGEQLFTEILLNPSIPIPLEATAIHKITNEMVKDKPEFQEVHHEILNIMAGAILSGFNVRNFDWPLLKAEFKRIAIDIEDPQIIDVMEIHQQMVGQSLADVYRHYVGGKLDGAHDAMVDVKATLECLQIQINEYELPKFARLMDKWLKTPKGNNVDVEGKFVWANGEIVCNFGKHNGTKLKDMDLGYLKWMRSGNFNPEIKKIARSGMGCKNQIPKNREEAQELFV